MFPKEQGWILTIDQASNAAGVALWYDGILKATETIKSARASDPISDRLRHQMVELEYFLNKYIPEGDAIRNVIFEGVRSRIVLVTVGAFLLSRRIRAHISPTKNFVETRTWKNWGKRHGATGPVKDVKGIRSLKETCPELFEKYNIKTDDEADAIFIYMAWRTR
jgi:hypothetical protein